MTTPIILWFRVTGTTPGGHKGRKAKKAAFAANLRKFKAALRRMKGKT